MARCEALPASGAGLCGPGHIAARKPYKYKGFFWILDCPARVMLSDLRFALRSIRTSPGFYAAVLAILGLGIGITVSVFSLVDGVVLHPLPYRDPERLVAIERVATKPPFESNGSFSYSDFEQFRENGHSFSDVAVTYRSGWSQIVLSDPRERIRGGFVLPNFFEMFGRRPLLGRVFGESENGEHVIVLSEPLAARRFGSAELALGRDLSFSGLKWRVIGIMPADFRVPYLDSQFWAPVKSHPEWIDRSEPDSIQRSERWDLMARLRPGVSLTAAQLEADAVYKPIDLERRAKLDRASVVPMRDHFTGQARQPFAILAASVGVLLLIACANVANLLLARAASRRLEFAIRAALGGRVSRLLRQSVAETIIVGLLAGALGVGLSFWMVGALRAVSPAGTPRLDEVHVDPRALLFAVALSVAMGLFLGIASAWRSVHTDAAEPLNSTARSGTRLGNRQRDLLVISEFALAMVLLTGSALLIRSFIAVLRTDPGFRPEHVLTARIELPPGLNDEQKSQFYRDAMERIRQMPGVQAVGAAQSIFQLDVTRTHALRIVEGHGAEPVAQWQALEWSQIAGDYFQVLGVPLVRGRFFDEPDGPLAPPVVIVNETLARRYWPGEDPIGKRLKGQDPRGPNGGKNDDWLTVVGVVKDMRAGGRERAPFSQVYEVQAQRAEETDSLVIRVSGNPAQAASAVRAAIAEVNTNVRILALSTMDQLLADQETQRRFETWLLALFSGAALALAALGVFAVMHFTVAAKTREIGIRIAVGARRTHVLKFVMSSGARLALTGVGIGAIASVWLTELLEKTLFRVSPTDPASFAAAATVLGAVAAVACLLPAWRASRVDPVNALRHV
jgi:putative ABC transport system permease protein